MQYPFWSLIALAATLLLAGNGSIPHLAMALLVSPTGIEVVHVPYKRGSQQVIALMAGESQVSLATVASVIEPIKAGRLRAIGVSAAQRTGARIDCAAPSAWR